MWVLITAPCREDMIGVVVANPRPIRWGGLENKSDEQLEFQRDALEELGKAI
tara:strand:- start:1189 stop:1344 length:156 start_codon:yes stop_codon:yes gene_type:complete